MDIKWWQLVLLTFGVVYGVNNFGFAQYVKPQQ